MELFDYMRFRWKSITAVLVIGLVIIALVGLRSGGRGYEARSQLLLSPPADQQASYASDLDRYINTQMTLLKTPGALEAEVVGTNATPALLAKSLSYIHDPQSDVVTFVVNSSEPQEAVTLVNAAANGFLDYTRALEDQPARLKSAAIQAQVKKAQAQLAKANAKIDDARAAFTAAHPAEQVPLPAELDPAAYSDATLATTRLQQLLTLQASSEVSQATNANGSRVLTPAVAAVRSTGWGPVTYIAAVTGLVLLILTAAAAGLALTNRVLSQSRWIEATEGGCFGRGIRLRKRTVPQRRQTVRRVATALDSNGGPEAPTFAMYLPENTSTLKRRTKFLLQGLAQRQCPPLEVGSITDLLAKLPSVNAARGVHARASGNAPSAQVLLLVDLAESRVDDVRLLCDSLQSVRRMVVPVLV